MYSFKLHRSKLNRPLIMGILNLTPDSFYDGGKYNTIDKAIKHALQMESEGADIIDVGAQSTRPNCTIIPSEIELKRLIPIFKELRKQIHIPLSVDTFYTEVAREALECGADIINDVSGRKDDSMLKLVKRYNSSIVVMDTSEKLSFIKPFFNEKLLQAKNLNLSEDFICFDVGIGFGKTQEDNARLIANLSKFKVDNVAMLVGLSGKRVLSFCSDDKNCDKEATTVATDVVAMLGGADILRVHSVKANLDAVKAVSTLLKLRGGLNYER